MSVFADRGATVNRLRIRCSGIDPLLAQLRAGRLLDETALQPAALPPSAILCIRRLTDPRPGVIALDGMQPPPAAWTGAVAASVGNMARGARRPGLGDVTPGAEAVLFADRAEMLACLAADWCAGRLGTFWWWRALLEDIGEARAVLRAWLKSPVYVAAALEDLACRGGATTFVARLEEADTRALLEAVIVQHDLKHLAPPLERFTRSTRSLPTTLTGSDGSVTDTQANHGSVGGVLLRAPWTQRVPESQPQSLRVDQQCLLGIALMTRRAPTIVRTSRFAADVHQWFAFASGTGSTRPGASDAAPAPSRHEPQLERSALIERIQRHDGLPAESTKDGDAPPALIAHTSGAGVNTLKTIESRPHATSAVSFWSHEAHARSAGGGATSEPAARGLQRRDRGLETAPRGVGAASNLGHRQVDRADPAARGQEQSTERPTASVGAPAISIAPSPPTPPAAQVVGSPLRAPTAAISTSYARSGTDQEQAIAATLAPNELTAPFPVARAYPAAIETEVGGVFYLLNVALRLGLYGDFTTPAQPGIGLSIWDFLTLAGRALTPRPFRRDPVWVLLAELAGRAPDEAPGGTFEPPDAWRLPAEWLDAFPEGGTWRSRECAGRLRVMHPAGFAIVDVPRAGDEEVVEQVERELSMYRSATSFLAGAGLNTCSAVLSGPRHAGLKAPRNTAALLRGLPPALAWWLRCLVPYVRARLARALGTSLPRRAGPLLCVQRSRVTTTPTHVDVFFPLAGLPIEVRLSGLDRNPGWVPAADRLIAFHYD